MRAQEYHQMQDEVGYCVASRDFMVFLDGLPTIKINDMVVSDNGIRGWVSSLYENKVEVLVLDEGIISPGQLFKRVKAKVSIATGEYLLGRAINPLGVPIDGKRMLSKSENDKLYELDTAAPPLSMRKFITDQFVTGVSLIDTLLPLGKGQRQLVIGDAHAGKTAFLLDLIINQRDSNVVCIYASIGKPITQVKSMLELLGNTGALAYTVMIAASSSEAAPLIYLTPQTAFTIAEYFQRTGRDVLLILDDIGNHAKIYREISLLSGRSPGRESYPGDIFYQHSHLLERAGSFKAEGGGGSITALPVLELNLSDFSGFLPTNLIGMTDGHLLFNSNLRNQGRIPAIDISLSVTRVGRQTQNRLQNLLSNKIRQLLAQAEDLETVSRFSAELPYETRLILKQKAIIQELISQEGLVRIPIAGQIVLLALPFTALFLDKDVNFIQKNKPVLLNTLLKDQRVVQFSQSLLKLEVLDELLKALEPWIPVFAKMFK